MAPSLRTLLLSSCELNVFPPWALAGLSGLETLDISNNQIEVLPVLSVLYICRIRLMDLSQNPFDCEGFCENAETKKYLDNNKQITLAGNLSFCPEVRVGCKVNNNTKNKQAVRQECLKKSMKKPSYFG
jgi:Leucine-rich repeat (LRR) protein